MSEAIIEALRNRAKRFFSLDTPANPDLGEVATDVAAGFVPGVGTALSARDFERARREGDALGMGLSAAGMIPVVGGAARAADKMRKGDAIVDALRAKYPKVAIDLSGDSQLYLGKIVVPKELRNQGIGTSVMNDLVRHADEAGATVTLTPAADFGGSVNRLREFYKRFGFVPNKGKYKDYAISESMYRLPASNEVTEATINALRRRD